MTVDDVRNIRIQLARHQVQRADVSKQNVLAALDGHVAVLARIGSRFAVPDVIFAAYDKAATHKVLRQIVVTVDVFGHAMNYLDNAFGFLGTFLLARAELRISPHLRIDGRFAILRWILERYGENLVSHDHPFPLP